MANNIRKVIVDWFHMVIKPQAKTIGSQNYVKEILIGASVALVLLFSVWGYRSYRAGKDAKAQLALAEAVYAYQQAAQDKGITYSHAELLLQEGYDAYSSTRLAPYFLVFKAEAQVHQGNLNGAVETLSKALILIPENTPLHNMYKTELALMQLDGDNEEAQTEALESLKSLAFDENNAARDHALYYLGSYYWSKNDIEQAKQAWNALITIGNQDKLSSSGWAAHVQEKLAQCSA